VDLLSSSPVNLRIFLEPWEAVTMSAMLLRAEYYRQRASHCAHLADTMDDQEAMFKFLRAANEWRKLADHFEGLASRGSGPGETCLPGRDSH